MSSPHTPATGEAIGAGPVAGTVSVHSPLEQMMCFPADSVPPVAPIAGGAIEHHSLELTADDGNRFAAFRADAPDPIGAGMLVLPDVRGLFPYYEELALRFAERGVDAIAIDYYGRTAGAARRDGDFDFRPHTSATTWAGLRADVAAAADELRRTRGIERLHSIGFCFGGRTSFLLGTVPELDMDGVIGFYGWPVGAGSNDAPAPADVADRIHGRVLGIFGGADKGISGDDVSTFERALQAASVDHRVVTYPDAPHSFFDRSQAEHRDASDAAWDEVRAFVGMD